MKQFITNTTFALMQGMIALISILVVSLIIRATIYFAISTIYPYFNNIPY